MTIGIETNIIYQGDCKEVLKHFLPNSIDLIYVDPPFFSNKNYEVIWGNGAELKAFEDRWKGGIEHYAVWMSERLEQMYRILKQTGTLYVHCDNRANWKLRDVLNRIFGDKRFRNEIVWCYTGPSKNVRDFPDKHDTILRYVKGEKWTFNINKIKVPYSQSFLERREHEEGKGGIFAGKMRDKMSSLMEYKKGKLPEDWWSDIPSGGQISRKELLGYPTQKPEKLLERIISVSSNEDDIVLDPMVGGGTTLAVAQRLKRRWIGIDVSPLACQMSGQRLRKLGVPSVPIIGGLITEKELRNFRPFEFQKWVCDKLFGRISDRKSSDMGIDGYTLEGTPIQVKQSDGVGRNVIDNFETAIRRVKKNKGIIVAFSFGRGTYQESARVKLDEGIEIKLITIKELLEGQNKEDLLEFKGH